MSASALSCGDCGADLVLAPNRLSQCPTCSAARQALPRMGEFDGRKTDEFFILSLPWTRKDLITWWCPNNSGYTCVLEQAGRYTREQIEQLPGYYNNGETTIALACPEVEAEAVRVVYGHRIEKLTGKRFRDVTDQDGARPEDLPSCDACGWSPVPKVLGLRVIEPAETPTSVEDADGHPVLVLNDASSDETMSDQYTNDGGALVLALEVAS